MKGRIFMKTSTFKLMSALLILVMLMATVLVLPAYAEESSLYITKINEKIGPGDGTIFTKDFKGTNKVKADAQEGNFIWAAVIAAEPTGNPNEFKVVYTGSYLEASTEVTIPEGGFVYAAHYDDREPESEIGKKSSANRAATQALKVGDILTLNNVDIANSKLGSNPSITVGAASGGNTSQATSSEAASSEATSSAASSAAASSAAASAETSSKVTSSDAKSASSAASSVEAESSEGLSTGAIIGIIAAVVVVVVVVVIVLAKKNKKD